MFADNGSGRFPTGQEILSGDNMAPRQEILLGLADETGRGLNP